MDFISVTLFSFTLKTHRRPVYPADVVDEGRAAVKRPEVPHRALMGGRQRELQASDRLKQEISGSLRNEM